MEQIKLNKIIRKHEMWLEKKEGGEQADLQGADLYGADLYEADLSWANLHDANLREADLHGANLSWADLHGADLYGADLHWADLCGADLREANLCGANLCGANLDFSCWPLWCGSLDVTVDKRIAAQLAYHFCRLICDDPEVKEAQKALAHLANQFHRAEECGKIEE